MSFTYPLTLKNVADADVVFNSIIINGQSTTSVDAASSDAEPRKLRISHSVEGKGLTKRNAHLVSIETTNLNAAGEPFLLTVNLSIKKPPNSEFSVTDVADSLRMVFDHLTSGTVPTVNTTTLGQLLRGES